MLTRSFTRNGRPYAPETLEEFEILTGVLECLNQLKAEGFLLIVVTNQPDVSKGVVLKEEVEAMHQILSGALPLDDIKVCYEIEEAKSPMRKPAPGMLLESAKERDIDLKRSFMVGDRWRDVGAGNAADCTSIFIDYGYEEKAPEGPCIRVASLEEAVKEILSKKYELENA